jgi:processive 1,2-diacylglycerol beta-glucosyltransferase
MSKYFLMILSASGGAGHRQAGEALLHAAHTLQDRCTAEHHDCLDFTSPVFKSLYAGSYLHMVNRAPAVWGYMYERTERRRMEAHGLLKLFDRFNYRRFLQEILDRNPDALVCTHFLPYISISRSLRTLRPDLPVYAVTTDFDAHQYWIDPVVRRYYVYHQESAWQLHAKGVPAEQIRVSGIPVLPGFARRGSRSAARKRLAIPRGAFTILFLSGGFGTGRMEETIGHLLGVLQHLAPRRFNVLIVCGKNERVRESLERSVFPPNVTARVVGFVENMHDFMHASDLLVSKAGGLTSAEAMAAGLPMIIVDPIPGQETRNADILVEYGAGWKALNLGNFMYKLLRVAENPPLLKAAREAALRLGRPQAARDILRDVLSDLTSLRRKGSTV